MATRGCRAHRLQERVAGPGLAQQGLDGSVTQGPLCHAGRTPSRLLVARCPSSRPLLAPVQALDT